MSSMMMMMLASRTVTPRMTLRPMHVAAVTTALSSSSSSSSSSLVAVVLQPKQQQQQLVPQLRRLQTTAITTTTTGTSANTLYGSMIHRSTHNHHNGNNVHYQIPIQRRCFSSALPDEKPIIPGINKGKTSTGLVGLEVEPDWYNVMLRKFQALLDKMESSDMPETAQYRIDVTKWCNYVIRTVKANPNDPEAVEDAVQMGQVEELIDMADDEMICLDTYLETRMWEVVKQFNPTIDFNPDPMRDPFDTEDGDPDEQEALRKGNEEQKKQAAGKK